MRDLKNDINFLPAHILQSRARHRIIRMVMLLLIFGLVTLTSLMIVPVSQIFMMNGDINALNKEKTTMASVTKDEKSLQTMAKSYKLREDIFKALSVSDTNVLNLLDQLEINMPKGAGIVSMALNKTVVTINGVSDDKLMIADLIFS